MGGLFVISVKESLFFKKKRFIFVKKELFFLYTRLVFAKDVHYAYAKAR